MNRWAYDLDLGQELVYKYMGSVLFKFEPFVENNVYEVFNVIE